MTRAARIKVVYATGRRVASRWRQQYHREEDGWKDLTAGRFDPKDIYERLRLLGVDPELKDIEEVIGNDSWTTLFCDGCSESVIKGIELSSSDRDFLLCQACIASAYKIAKDM